MQCERPLCRETFIRRNKARAEAGTCQLSSGGRTVSQLEGKLRKGSLKHSLCTSDGPTVKKLQLIACEFALIRIVSKPLGQSSQTQASRGQTIADYYKFKSRLRIGTILQLFSPGKVLILCGKQRYRLQKN